MERTCNVQLRTVETMGKAETGRLSSEVTDLQKANMDLQRRHTQFQHELRRKDREFERLQVLFHPSTSVPEVVKDGSYAMYSTVQREHDGL